MGKGIQRGGLCSAFQHGALEIHTPHFALKQPFTFLFHRGFLLAFAGFNNDFKCNGNPVIDNVAKRG